MMAYVPDPRELADRLTRLNETVAEMQAAGYRIELGLASNKTRIYLLDARYTAACDPAPSEETGA